MLFRNIAALAAVSILLGLFSGLVFAEAPEWRMVYGDILQVFSEQRKILLDSAGTKRILILEADCEILRAGYPTALGSLRPIGPGAFQDALCWLNSEGLVSYILVNYSVSEERSGLVYRDIFGNVK